MAGLPADAQALEWTEHGPRSARFDDVYFSASDGLAEARAVFLVGCGLPQGWAGRSSYVVGELGFGTGLNILALLDLWRRTRPHGARLHVVSVEAFPLSLDEAARALGAWPELGDLSASLLAQWPDGRRGFHRIDWTELDAGLDLWIGEAAEGLAAWEGRADAWFLDGFAPAKNPQMWRAEVLQLVSARSAAGARLASFTVAGQVRRTLQDVGFSVEKVPGFGRKRERLQARSREPVRVDTPAPARIAVVGAGVAGAAMVRALRRLGASPSVIDAAGPGAGASGNPSALVAARFDAGFGPSATLSAQAFARAVDLYRREVPEAILAEGAVQLEVAPKDAARFDRIAEWPGFAPGALAHRPAEAIAQRLSERSCGGGMTLRDALVIQPSAVLCAWFGGEAIRTAPVAALERSGAAWRLLDEAGGSLAEAEAVVLSCGPHAETLLAGLGLSASLRPVRGQVSWTAGVEFDGAPASWGGYAIPLPERGVLFGATHDRDDWGLDLRPEDALYNRQLLARGRPRLAAALERAGPEAALDGRAGLRACAPDYSPVVGPVVGAPGLYILSGLGGRGFTLAPLLAEHLAARLYSAPSPLPLALHPLIDPARFAARDRPARRTDQAPDR